MTLSKPCQFFPDAFFQPVFRWLIELRLTHILGKINLSRSKPIHLVMVISVPFAVTQALGQGRRRIAYLKRNRRVRISIHSLPGKLLRPIHRITLGAYCQVNSGLGDGEIAFRRPEGLATIRLTSEEPSFRSLDIEQLFFEMTTKRLRKSWRAPSSRLVEPLLPGRKGGR